MSLPVKALVSALLAAVSTIAEEVLETTTRKRQPERRRPASDFTSSEGFSPLPITRLSSNNVTRPHRRAFLLQRRMTP
jgi:hypothetical protein